MRKVFIDLGANYGEISKKFAVENPDFEIFAFEANPELEKEMAATKHILGKKFSYSMKAAWIINGEISLYKSDHHMASTVLTGKQEPSGWNPISYGEHTVVPCIDICGWIDKEFSSTDIIIVKMDVEGAEYQIITKMIFEGTIFKISKLICEWHGHLFPHKSKEEHDLLYRKTVKCVSLVDWI